MRLNFVRLNGMLEGNFPFSVIKEILRKLGWERGECYVECTVVEREGQFAKERQIHLQLFDIDQEIPEEIQEVIKARIKTQFKVKATKFDEIILFIHDLQREGCKRGYLDLRVSGRWNGRIRMGWSADGSGWINLRTERYRR
jgi:hypothetical protein